MTYLSRNQGEKSLKEKYAFPRAGRIAVTGSTGLIGSALVPLLQQMGQEVVALKRSGQSTESNSILWDPEKGIIDSDRLEGLDSVIHLAGENIAGKRWSARQKERIRTSRVQGTSLLCQTLARLRQPPRVLIQASAVGIYGNRGDEALTESSPGGQGFLPEVCQAWEGASRATAEVGIRVVHMRLGIVLSPNGGALKQMLLPFSLGLGGRLGTGKQWLSWIALVDVLGALLHSFLHEEISGPVNVIAPNPVTNAEFTKTLGRVLHRPTVFPLPVFLLRLLFGEMAQDLLLSSAKVLPGVLEQTGYGFQFASLESALRGLLGKSGKFN